MRRHPRWPLIAALLALALPAAALPPPKAVYVGSYRWQIADRAFGGFSGLELSDDGTHFTALSDRGHITEGTLSRDAAGAVTGATAGPLLPLLGEDGRPLPLWKADSEGLAIAPSGHVFISFEEVHRVLDYPRVGGVPKVLPRHPDFARMEANKSLEALEIDRHGWLYTTPERVSGDGLKIYRYRHGVWDQPFTLPKDGAFLPTGADFGPDGKLYLLERDYSLLGFRSRVRRFTLGAKGVDAGETLLESPLGTFDNLEGIAVWSDAQHHIRLTMVSDDNFSPFQITQFVDYRVTE
ncbi:MAG: esterase-like activity of phytase family protein [Rhodobacteraceae bacterium]|nr:esterase-like activity of phytase family protein [Paracoccaceae bacterium]